MSEAERRERISDAAWKDLNFFNFGGRQRSRLLAGDIKSVTRGLAWFEWYLDTIETVNNNYHKVNDAAEDSTISHNLLFRCDDRFGKK